MSIGSESTERPMRMGIISPVLFQHPATASAWEAGAGIDEVSAIATIADRLGYFHLTCGEHVAVPTEVAEVRGGTYWDPLATFGFIAARTTQIRLATHVLVLGYHHPLEIAKRYGTLDRISGGRLVLGIGVGSLEEEFELLNAPFGSRGRRADDALAALRASLSTPIAEYHGEFYDYQDFIVEPHATQETVPIWIGGRTQRSLRRAIQHGNGWAPFGLDAPQLRDLLSRSDLPSGFDVVLSSMSAVDPLAEPDETVRSLRALREAGATIANASITARDVDHYGEQLEELRRIATDEGVVFSPY